MCQEGEKQKDGDERTQNKREAAGRKTAPVMRCLFSQGEGGRNKFTGPFPCHTDYNQGSP